MCPPPPRLPQLHPSHPCSELDQGRSSSLWESQSLAPGLRAVLCIELINADFIYHVTEQFLALGSRRPDALSCALGTHRSHCFEGFLLLWLEDSPWLQDGPLQVGLSPGAPHRLPAHQRSLSVLLPFPTYSSPPLVSVCSGCRDRVAETGGLKHKQLSSDSSGGSYSETEVSAGLVSSGISPRVPLMAVFSIGEEGGEASTYAF